MNRRTFMGVAASAVLAATQGVSAEPAAPAPSAEGIRLRFLGTGAADWNGRDDRGELRRLSSILLDKKVLVDFTPTDADMIPEGCRPEVIFYTHSHADHYNAEAAIKLGVRRAYVNHTWYDIAATDFRAAAARLKMTAPTVIPVCIGQPINEGGLTFTPLPANHATSHLLEQTQIFLIEKGDTRLIYATDTGGLMGVATRMAGIDAHQKGTPITALIMEATMGMKHELDFRLFTHSSVALVERTVKILTQTGRYLPPEGQYVYLTHLARTLHGTQAELDAELPEPLRAASDGMEVLFRPNPAIRQ